MENKVTAKDVAQKAGVSVATVSYVMNGRTDQKISNETKKKILQIANLLNYVPSHAAKSLATGKNNAIGIAYNMSDSLTKTSETMHFVNMLIERLNRMKFDVIFLPSRKAASAPDINRNIDAIVAIDLTHDDFRALADNYLVPVICVDMIVNDTLFYQIYEDTPFLIEKALLELNPSGKCYLIYDSYDNASFENFLLSLPENVFPLRKRELSENMLEKIKNSEVIVLGAYLTLYLAGKLNLAKTIAIISEDEKNLLPADIKTFINNDVKKANLTTNIVCNAIDRNFEINHDQRIK